MKIRHEINLLNGTVVGATTASERSLVDPSQYSGTVTCYFEVQALITSGTAAVALWDNTGAANVTTVTVNSATTTLFRSSSFSLASSKDMSVKGAANVTVKAARVIVIQDTGSDPLLSSEAQIEIGSRSAVTATTFPTGATATNQTNPKYWKYVAADWNGAVSFLFEAALTSPASKTAAQVQLQVADGTGDGFTGWANVTNGNVTSLSATSERVRASAAFTPTDGRWYRIVSLSPASKTAMNVYCARIIVRQVLTSSAKLSQTSGANGFPIFGPADTSGTRALGQGFAPSADIALTKINLYLSKTGTPTDTIYAEIATGSFGGAVLYTSASVNCSSLTGSETSTDFNFSSPFPSLSSGVTYYLQVRRTATDSSNYPSCFVSISDVYASGFLSMEGEFGWGDQVDWDVKFVLTGVDSYVTKLEETYLLSNTLLAAGTAFQSFFATDNPAEWSGVTNTYSGQAAAANGSTSVATIQKSDGSVTYCTVSSPDNGKITAFSSTPGSSVTLDVKATTNNGDLYSVSVIAAVVKTVAAAVTRASALINGV